jgi:hypothetical protein
MRFRLKHILCVFVIVSAICAASVNWQWLSPAILPLRAGDIWMYSTHGDDSNAILFDAYCSRQIYAEVLRTLPVATHGDLARPFGVGGNSRVSLQIELSGDQIKVTDIRSQKTVGTVTIGDSAEQIRLSRGGHGYSMKIAAGVKATQELAAIEFRRKGEGQVTRLPILVSFSHRDDP